jgi:hypothetical protein
MKIIHLLPAKKSRPVLTAIADARHANLQLLMYQAYVLSQRDPSSNGNQLS